MNLLNIWDSIWIALLASAILHGCYRAIEWRWPERYIGIYQTFGLSTQETLARFFGYRVLPVYVLMSVLAVTVQRVDGSAWISALVVFAVGILPTHGLALASNFRQPREVNYGLFHAAMIFLLAAALALATWSRNSWSSIVPQPADLLSAVWSGLIVAGLGGFVIFSIRPRDGATAIFGANYFVDRAEKREDIELFDRIFASCIRFGADPILVKAIAIAESAQRPKWFRFLERLGVKVGASNTSGLMQMASGTPLSDEESIDRAAQNYRNVWSLRVYESEFTTPLVSVDIGEVWGVLTSHNGDGSFASRVVEIAQALWGRRPKGANDPTRPMPLELRRHAGTFEFRGISQASGLLVLLDDDRRKSSHILPTAPAEGGWWAWSFSTDPSVRRVLILNIDALRGVLIAVENGQMASVEDADADDHILVTR